MEIYDVDVPEEDRLAGLSRSLVFVICFPLSAICFSPLLWRDPELSSLWAGARVELRVVMVLFMLTMCSVYSLAMSFFFSLKKFRLAITEPWKSYQIIVEENRIRTRNFKSQNRWLCKNIPRGQVVTFREKEKGLLISIHGRVGTFCWGGIWIPKRLVAYDHLREMLSGWKTE